jgi:hypothetical protein
MKQLFLRLFLRDRLIGQIASAAAAAAAAYLMTLIPGLPAIAQAALAAALSLPEGATLTQGGLTAALTPVILAVINGVVQELVARDNNKVLAELKLSGVYDGKLDGWVGPIAKKGIKILADRTDPHHTDL